MLLSIWSASTFIKRRNRGTSRTAVQCIWMEFVDHGRGAKWNGFIHDGELLLPWQPCAALSMLTRSCNLYFADG